MVFGYKCPCCGNAAEERAPADDGTFVLPVCMTCDDDPNAAPPDMSVYTIPLETSVVFLEASAAFAGLTETERLYAYWIGKASWEGAKICLLQCSAESVPIFCLLQAVFSAQPLPALLEGAKAKGLTDTEVERALMYSAAFYGNLGNYKSFGDSKFVPELPADRFEAFLSSGAAPAEEVASLWAQCAERMYSLTPRQRQMGLGAANGVSTYFSANCEEEDAELAGKFLESKGLSAYNTRLMKAGGRYTVLLASASTTQGGNDPVGKLCGEHSYEGATFEVRRGDYAPLMGRVAAALQEAQKYAANEAQGAMMGKYVESFGNGSIEDHKDASRFWIEDKGPAVESYIGFIESYRDPSGVRGEWEGFTACVNREVSRKFQALVDGAEQMLTLMPWDALYEKDKFLRPDFTSLEVLAFGSSGVPAGINIPNYDDIRQSEGFKNVSLGNVLAASYGAGAKPVTFVRALDQQIFKALKGPAFEVQVGVHELLGHGSGKLFHQGAPDTAELLAKRTPHPISGQPIDGPFYAAGATWDSTFGKLASAYEECRAECCGIYLCLEPVVLTIFGHPPAEGAPPCGDIPYVNWLLMARAGLTGLEFYTPTTDSWRQAHMHARYVILRVLLEAGEGLVSLNRVTGEDGKPDIEVVLQRDLIATVGRAAIGRFLLALQVHKSLGDQPAGAAMFAKYSEVPPEMLEAREIVMARKEPRKLLVQPVMEAAGDVVSLHAFEESPAGMIASFVKRFPPRDDELMALHLAEKAAVED